MPSALAEAAYQTALDRVSVRATAQRFWDRTLQESNRKKLGPEFRDALQKHGNAAGFLLALNPKLIGEQAVLEVALAVGFLSHDDYQWLLREQVGDEKLVQIRERPEWNRAVGELKFQGKVIRRVRVGVGWRIVSILDKFELHGWPDRVDSPITDDMVHRDAIGSLNDTLKEIQFSSDGTGRGVVWKTLPSSTD